MNHTETAPETIFVAKEADGVSCDGGNGALGHPKVWYDLRGKSQVSCQYCGRLFIKSS